MCGRLNVTDHPGVRDLCEALGISLYKAKPNKDLRPTQNVVTLGAPEGQLSKLDTQWGIQPVWSKKLLINAQAETVSEKRTFAKAFRERRCVVPCTGWYEWKDEGGAKKQRYLFTHSSDDPFYMAGIWYAHEEQEQLVTLTTEPNSKCAKYHHRMPVLISPKKVEQYIYGGYQSLGKMLMAIPSTLVSIKKYAA